MSNQLVWLPPYVNVFCMNWHKFMFQSEICLLKSSRVLTKGNQMKKIKDAREKRKKKLQFLMTWTFSSDPSKLAFCVCFFLEAHGNSTQKSGTNRSIINIRLNYANTHLYFHSYVLLKQIYTNTRKDFHTYRFIYQKNIVLIHSDKIKPQLLCFWLNQSNFWKEQYSFVSGRC